MRVLLITGGAGFVGSNFIKYFLRRNKNFIVINIDKLTNGKTHENLAEFEDSPRYHFVKGDICNRDLINYILKRNRPEFIINFAAACPPEATTLHEKNTNNAIVFTETNIIGMLTLLESARYIWGKNNFKGNRFIQVSTDEVYGNLSTDNDYFLEESNLNPDTPFAASKAGADLTASAFSKTYGVPLIITRCCNNYGPGQQSDQLIPRCIDSALNDTPIPIYRNGTNIKEWIHVQDHSIALIRALFTGNPEKSTI